MSPIIVLVIIGFFFLLFGLFIIYLINKSKQNSLIPSGKIIYDDLHGSSYSLYSNKYPLVGKPDLIIKKGWRRIPIEVKTGNHHFPKIHHMMQLIAYCQLTKEHFNKSTPFGYLIYPDTKKRFKIAFSRAEKNQLRENIHLMRNTMDTGIVYRNHDNKKKCDSCKMKNICKKKID